MPKKLASVTRTNPVVVNRTEDELIGYGFHQDDDVPVLTATWRVPNADGSLGTHDVFLEDPVGAGVLTGPQLAGLTSAVRDATKDLLP